MALVLVSISCGLCESKGGGQESRRREGKRCKRRHRWNKEGREDGKEEGGGKRKECSMRKHRWNKEGREGGKEEDGGKRKDGGVGG